jgi:hypothetical protein
VLKFPPGVALPRANYKTQTMEFEHATMVRIAAAARLG